MNQNNIYEKIKILISEIIEDKNPTYPLKIFDLVKRMGFNLVPYSSLKNSDLLIKASDDGFTITNKKNIPSIYFNDKANLNRQKFTIAHELGHIMIYYSLGLKDEKYANFFAGYILVPIALLLKFNINTVDKIKNNFLVSEECAKVAFENLKRRCNYKYSGLTIYEDTIIDVIDNIG